MLTPVVVVTALVLTLKFALVAPEATGTLDRTCATDVLLLESVTLAPLAGAGPLKVTVPVDELPPTTLLGLRLTEDAVSGGMTVKVAPCVELP